MEAVSQAWKAAQRRTLVPPSEVEVRLSVTDPEAAANVQAEDNGTLWISDTKQITNELAKSPRRYATGERNLWLLDGTFELIPDAPPYGDNGYISGALCGEDGVFTKIPTITLTFNRVYDSMLPGLSIDWGTAYGTWCSRFRVTVYAQGAVVSRDEARTDQVRMIWARDITHFDKIVVEILEWSLPRQRARIEQLTVGITSLFTKSDLLSYTHSMRVDPLSAELPKCEITFSVRDLEGSYDPYNPTGAERYMMTRQMVTSRYGYELDGEVEWINGGTFYLSEWDLPQNGIKAGFAARDILELMEDVFTGTVSGSLGDVIRTAIGQVPLTRLADGSSRWVVDSSLDVIPAASADLSKNTVAEVVQYAANAGCCAMLPDRRGRLVVAPLGLPPAATDYPLDRYVSYANAELSLDKQLKSINVNDGQYVLKVGDVGEEERITNPLITDAQAPQVARWAADYLTHRNVLTGRWRADPRLEVLDRATNENRFGEKIVLLTEVEFTYNGAFRGSYEAREGC